MDGNGAIVTEGHSVPETEVASAAEKPTQLTVEDRLRAENAQLQVQVLTMQKERFILGANQQVEAFDSRLTELRVQITAMQAEFKEKYSIDFTKQQIESGTGRIIPAP